MKFRPPFSSLRVGQDLLEKRHPVLFLFYPISLIWGFVVFCKNWLYDRALFSSQKMSKPVVSIGNLVVGGTGKTPLTLLLARTFSHRKVAVLSRGVSLQGPLYDEPALLAQRCKALRVYLGKDRRISAKKAIQEGAELLFLDDGLQHRKIFREFDIVLVSSKNPFSQHRYLPCGTLRDSPTRLKQADLICVNPIYSERELFEWHKVFSTLSQPLVGVYLAPSRLVPDREIKSLPVALFCGIAHPDSFRKTVLDLGAVVAFEWILADHEAPSLSKLLEFAFYAKKLGAKALICTEKDFVKLPKNFSFPLPILYPEMELKISAGHQNWQNLVDKIEQKIDNYKTYGT